MLLHLNSMYPASVELFSHVLESYVTLAPDNYAKDVVLGVLTDLVICVIYSLLWCLYH